MGSGCNSHMTGGLSFFSDIGNSGKQESVSVANNSKMFVNGIGEVSLKLRVGDKITVENVWYIPDLATNLLSVSKISF